MKLEIGKLYKTRNGNTIHIIDKRDYYGGDKIMYLGVLQGTMPETFWYTSTGRMYEAGISPYDIEKEIQQRVEFKSKFTIENNKVYLKWPKRELIKDLVNQKVKITIEIIND